MTRRVDGARERTALRGARPVHGTRLGNMVEWTDDAGAFYERSLGAEGQLGNGFDDPGYVASLPRPGALYFSTNVRDFDGTPDPLVDRGGWLDVSYGEGGNATLLTVRAQCHDADASTSCWDDTTQDYASRGAQLRTRCVCAEEQHYEYRWDELNRLSEARRYDRHGAGVWQLGVRQRMRYDGANQRTLKETSGDADVATGAALPERTTLYVYPGDYERRGVVRDPIAGTYEASVALGTESQYLVGGARITWKHGTPAAGIDRDARIAMSFTDMLGSSTAVVDLVSGSLMEAGMFYPSGARETRVVNQTATFSLEPTGFTGKEEDEEVGLTYFGERYLIARLARWASPDPLQVHAMGGGEAMNSYHYVAGNLLQATDPTGLYPTSTHGRRDQSQAESAAHDPGSSRHEASRFQPTSRRHTASISDFVIGGAVIAGYGILGALGDLRIIDRGHFMSQRFMHEYISRSGASATTDTLNMSEGSVDRLVSDYSGLAQQVYVIARSLRYGLRSLSSGVVSPSLTGTLASWIESRASTFDPSRPAEFGIDSVTSGEMRSYQFSNGYALTSLGAVKMHLIGSASYTPPEADGDVGRWTMKLRLVIEDTFDFHAGAGTGFADHAMQDLQLAGETGPFRILGVGSEFELAFDASATDGDGSNPVSGDGTDENDGE